jgi:hypothetical protein
VAPLFEQGQSSGGRRRAYGAVYNDASAGRDWFRPLIPSSLIYAEGNYRSKIGLPSLLLESDTAFHHISFAHLVAVGTKSSLCVGRHVAPATPVSSEGR